MIIANRIKKIKKNTASAVVVSKSEVDFVRRWGWGGGGRNKSFRVPGICDDDVKRNKEDNNNNTSTGYNTGLRSSVTRRWPVVTVGHVWQRRPCRQQNEKPYWYDLLYTYTLLCVPFRVPVRWVFGCSPIAGETWSVRRSSTITRCTRI